ncbi:HpcH/HpaI aldolase/citrate lyase family protein [Streptomyces sp. NPDC001978]|uniref:HpcH/HpaI aldolase/citrate lyase family protein n=1 Tax=Streptomyces sp. NPDC001978 TaxID=3364627 RepID=UPI00369EEFCB
MTASARRLESARSLLFVPGHRPDRFAKAGASDADLIIIDLEDAVAPQAKDQARDHAAAWFAQGGSAVLRINPPGTPWYDADLALAASAAAPVMVPKAEDAAVLSDLVCRLPGSCPLIPLIETAPGVERAAEVCAVTGTVRAAFGNVDLAGQLGVAPDDHLALGYARSRLVTASASAGISAPIDGVTTSIRDTDALAADIAHARRMGFTAKLCIHPNQLRQANTAFTPTDEERRWARAVIDAQDSLAVVDGQMVDKPVIERARRILAAT